MITIENQTPTMAPPTVIRQPWWNRIDLQDVLLVAGSLALIEGVDMIYIPAAVMLFGVMCLVFALAIERAKSPRKGNDKK